ncbi:MAG TPA: molybdenum ABC transporter ATP-binding protein [Pirellulales bacterium]|jgi:molybdate transport system ATP-binding protein|nr:molybdenum ABC transporter ATP-binding protein [Pirellulales bacterium]
MSQTTSLLALDCHFRYPEGFGLEVKFEASAGITALFGPSGAGKTTALALIAGILRPDSGTIRLGDRVLVDTEAGVFLPPEQRRIGVVFQEGRLFPHLSVRENLTFSRRAKTSPITLPRVVEILEIGGLVDQRPERLSGGERQRVALGRALLSDPRLLVMDEPVSALDEPLKQRVLDCLARVVAEWHLPALFVSHDSADVRRLADRVVLIAAGRTIAAGSADILLDGALLAGLAHGPPLVNLLRIERLRDAGNHWEGFVGSQMVVVPAAGRPAAQSALVQFLPHDVILSAQPVAGLSVRNQLPGVVRQMVTLPGRVLVALDVGQLVWAEVTPAAASELHVETGRTLYCLIKSTALTVVG